MRSRKKFIIYIGVPILLFFVFTIFAGMGDYGDKDVIEESSPEEENKETRKDIPEPLNLTMPDHIEDPFYPCANLNVEDDIKEKRRNIAEEAKVAKERNNAVLGAIDLPYELYRGDENINSVALTIDTGTGGADGVEELLQIAAHYNIPLTFFLTGCWVLQNPELTQSIVVEGHSIGNHSMTHRNLGVAPDDVVEWEISETDRVIYDVTGIKPAMFRKPLYAGGDRLVEMAGDSGMISVQGFPDLGDTGGWARGATPEGVYATIERKTAPGAIWVLHNLSVADLKAFEDVVRMHLEEGYELVRVEDMF